MSAITELLNRVSGFVLELDPEGAAQIAGLSGKRLSLELSAPRLTLIIEPTENGLKISEPNDKEPDTEPDVTLCGSALDFVEMGVSGNSGNVVRDGRIHMSGDVETGQAFQKALSQLDLDWEEVLARYIGDSPARKAGLLMRELGLWARQSVDLTTRNVADVLTEESRILAARPALDRFERNMTAVRGDVDRLGRRLDDLMKKHGVDAGDA